nr:MAG TPA: hypothetical protein [Caudoviricetes sp.]
MQEHQEHEGFPFTVEVLQLTRNQEIVGRCFRITCNTCKQRNPKPLNHSTPWSSKTHLKSSAKKPSSTPTPTTTPTTPNKHPHPKDTP